ncbi:MAG: helix-turn-helix domain-containing protein [Elusimicrobia bacterium]|nr:helix-turn-helix domain-containing protein [Elusimicrobiota bacterium]
MSDIGSVLREEIQRLARRVSRQADRRLKRDVVRMKHQIAELNRQVDALRRDNAKLVADFRERLAAPPVADAGQVEGARLSPRLIRSRRKRLGLSREAFARLLGVSAGAVLAWEGGRSKPRAAARAALVAVRALGRREAHWRLEAMDGKPRRPEAAKAR